MALANSKHVIFLLSWVIASEPKSVAYNMVIISSFSSVLGLHMKVNGHVGFY